MHVYRVQNIVTGAVKDVHVIPLRFYAGKDLEMTSGFKGGVPTYLHTGRV